MTLVFSSPQAGVYIGAKFKGKNMTIIKESGAGHGKSKRLPNLRLLQRRYCPSFIGWQVTSFGFNFAFDGLDFPEIPNLVVNPAEPLCGGDKQASLGVACKRGTAQSPRKRRQ